MKHTPILFALSAAAILTACEKKISEREKMDAREVSALEVQYKVDGNETRSLAFPHQFTRQVVQVEVNNDGLRWNIESDSDWCKVVPEDHRGPGSFTLELEANESFENREPADSTSWFSKAPVPSSSASPTSSQGRTEAPTRWTLPHAKA